eukprot:TRINITY_DN3243_c0_g1_i1.p1 TRINITY_DN3243_c0_g1~~TRINITY_DN3243_c0_g1_i1.p1  ORF type:complete len:635 (-),score=158.14 TRINITY_DN3243_c0_g1_i1:177-2081(-)
MELAKAGLCDDEKVLRKAMVPQGFRFKVGNVDSLQQEVQRISEKWRNQNKFEHQYWTEEARTSEHFQTTRRQADVPGNAGQARSKEKDESTLEGKNFQGQTQPGEVGKHHSEGKTLPDILPATKNPYASAGVQESEVKAVWKSSRPKLQDSDIEEVEADVYPGYGAAVDTDADQRHKRFKGGKNSNNLGNKRRKEEEDDTSSQHSESKLRQTFITASQKMGQGGIARGKAEKNVDNNRPTMMGRYVVSQSFLSKQACQTSNYSGTQAGNLHVSGGLRRGVRSSFVSPVRPMESNAEGTVARPFTSKEQQEVLPAWLEALRDEAGQLPERLRNLEPRLLEHISNEIMTKNTHTTWKDIAGLEHAKRCVTEMVIWPLKRPDLFQGTRAPGTGLLLYGPPGTGKTLIGKAIAGESNATFFSISASSLTSKWIGEGEKLVRALFGVASCRQPAVIFVDEIDSLLSQRKTEGEHESSRRLKTQFLIEMEGCGSEHEQILLIGATNRPHELDEAARRRMTKRLYIPLPEAVARGEIVKNLLQHDGLLSLSEDDIQIIASETSGYSGSDMANLVKEASMAPLREAMMTSSIANVKKEELRPICLEDFQRSLKSVRPSVAASELKLYEDWARQFGSGDLVMS